MPDVSITIEGVQYTPRYGTIKTMLNEALCMDGKLTRISRRDGGCDYRLPGLYDLTWCVDEAQFQVTLEVKP